MSPFGLIALLRQRRQRAVGGIADHAQRRKGNACLGGIGCRDMAFHVDRGSPGLRVQRGLAGLGGNHLLDAGETAPDHAPALAARRWRSSPRSAPDRPASAYRRPALRSPPRRRPDFSDGSSPPATPKLITPRNVDGSSVASSARNCCGSLLLQMTVMPGPAAMRASCTSPVTIKTGRGSIEIALNRLSTVAAARPQIHIPTPTTLLLVLLKFRYRANAQSGKNFGVAMISQIKHPRKACSRVALLIPQPFFRLCAF